MKHHRPTASLVSAAILFSASFAWAAEPSQPAANANNVPSAAQEPTVAGAVGTPTAATSSAPAVEATAEQPAAVPPPVATATNPNSVGASPYGNVNGDSQVVTPPAPRAKDDVPATLFASGQDYAIGGFGGFGVAYTRFAGSDRPLVCGEGAVIIDHRFTLGGGGCGIAAVMDGSKYGNAPSNPRDRMSFGYGGAIIRYHFFSRNAVNLAVGAIVGAGGIQIATWNGTGSQYCSDQNCTNKGQDAVFIFEPQVGGYANLTRWLRVGAVAGFRVVSGVDTKGLSASDLMGPTLGGQLQGGWF